MDLLRACCLNIWMWYMYFITHSLWFFSTFTHCFSACVIAVSCHVIVQIARKRIREHCPFDLNWVNKHQLENWCTYFSKPVKLNVHIRDRNIRKLQNLEHRSYKLLHAITARLNRSLRGSKLEFSTNHACHGAKSYNDLYQCLVVVDFPQIKLIGRSNHIAWLKGVHSRQTFFEQ